MNPVYLQVASDVILFLISAAVATYLYMTKKSQVNSSRIDDLEKLFRASWINTPIRIGEVERGAQRQINELSGRITKVEGSRPTLEKLSQDIGTVHSRIDETKDIVSRLEGEYRASKGRST